MNMVFKLMIFGIMINVATGAMMNALPEIFDGDNDEHRGGFEYNESYISDFNDNFNRSVNPSEKLEDTSNFLDRILDKISIGIWGKVLSTLNQYMFGLSQLGDQTVGRFMNQEMRGFWFGSTDEHPLGIIRVIISIGYILGAIFMWTGRDLRN